MTETPLQDEDPRRSSQAGGKPSTRRAAETKTTASEAATYLAYAGGWQAVRRMPEPMAYSLFEKMADRQWHQQGRSVQRLEANLRRVLTPISDEELRGVSREGMRSYLRYWCDAFRLPGWDRARIDSFVVENPEVLHAALARGGTVIALPHMGNWDHAGAYASLHFSPVHTVAEVLRPVKLFERFVQFRSDLGMTIHGLGEAGVFEKLAATLSEGGLVALLADRDLSAKGVEVTLMGEATRFPAGPAAQAVDTGATLLAADLYWIPDPDPPPPHGRNAVTLIPVPVDAGAPDRRGRIHATTQSLADILGEAIGRHPSDWHMLQRLWLADLDQSRLAAADAAEPGVEASVEADGPESDAGEAHGPESNAGEADGESGADAGSDRPEEGRS